MDSQARLNDNGPVKATSIVRPVPGLLWLAFFLSGLAGLSYELVWVRYVGRIVGGSTPAIAATVAIFFTGLACGSWAGARVFQRLRRPLWGYALIELCVALTAALVPSSLIWIEGSALTSESLPAALGLAALALLPATALLGATFPAMAAVIEEHTDPCDGTARFYGLNTAGAVAGCLLTALVLLPTWGHHTTNLLMVGTDVVVAVMAALLARRQGAPPRRRSPALDAPSEAEEVTAPISFTTAAVLAATSGALAIAVEVLWTRALSLSFPATVYVFAVVLAAYLCGIACGSLLLPRLRRRARGPGLLATLYLLTAAGVLLSTLAFPRLASLFYALVGTGSVSTWGGWISGIGLAAFGAMLPATVAMGAALPLLVGLASGPRDRPLVAGRLYTLNVLGGVLGSLLATFALMPWAGLSPALALLGSAYVALPLLLWRAPTTWARRATLAAIAVACAAASLLRLSPDVDPDRAPPRGSELLYAKDGPSGTIAIYHHRSRLGVPVRSLKVNNFYGLNITAPGTVAMQYRLGYLPLALHPAPQRALLVGFATGNTLAAMADSSLPKGLHCVELHEELFALGRFFTAVNQGIHRRRGVSLVGGDGRRFMLRESPRYDVIVGDLYLPRNPGTGGLYSLEYFRSVRRRLRPGGVFVAWLPLWQLAPEETGIIARTFLQVFPSASGVLGNRHHSRPVLGLVTKREGSAGPVPWRRVEALVRTAMERAYGRAWRPPEISAASSALGKRDVSNAVLRAWARGKALNTLENAHIEYSAPRTLTRYQLRRGSPAADNLRALQRLREKSLPSAPPVGNKHGEPSRAGSRDAPQPRRRPPGDH